MPADWLERPEHLIGSVLGGRYRITALIGRGPLGIVYEGESSRGRQVTLKLLPRPHDLAVEHFAWQVRQAFALAHFDHANVAPVTDFGALDDGSAFVSRSRVPGVTLRSLVRQGALPLRRALDIARQIAAGLAAGHAQEIAHGRLKPENVLVQANPRGGDLVRIVDYGMAGLAGTARVLATHSPAGSEHEARLSEARARAYLPADAGTGASAHGDVYALAVILFEMIGGQQPFALEGILLGGPHPLPLTFAQCTPPVDVPIAVSDWILGLLRPRGNQPMPSSAQVAHALDGLLGRPSVARAQSPDPAAATTQLRASPAAATSPSRTSGASNATARAEPPPFRLSGTPAVTSRELPALPPQFPSSPVPAAPMPAANTPPGAPDLAAPAFNLQAAAAPSPATSIGSASPAGGAAPLMGSAPPGAAPAKAPASSPANAPPPPPSSRAKPPPLPSHLGGGARGSAPPATPLAAATASYPPLPPGMAKASRVTPPPPSSPGMPPPPSSRNMPPPPSSRGMPPLPPSARGSAPPAEPSPGNAPANYPTPPSYPPLLGASGTASYPPVPPTFPPSPGAEATTPSDNGDEDTEFRPSLIGRLRKLFVRKPPDEL